MSTTGVMRFVVLGAVGFGIGGAIAFGALVLIPVGGAVGGAALGLTLKDWKRAALLALLGALGLTLGVFASVTLAALFNYSSAPIGALVGAVVGASLGAAFGDWRRILALAVVGGVGFGVGLSVGDFLPWDHLPSLLVRFLPGTSIVIAGAIGGASLGAALGYLEKHRLAGGPRSA